jgi:hypothetical protein
MRSYEHEIQVRTGQILLKNSIGAHFTGWGAPARVGKRLNLLEHWSARNAQVDLLKSNSEFFNSIGIKMSLGARTIEYPLVHFHRAFRERPRSSGLSVTDDGS